jgi:hypothetical protein
VEEGKTKLEVITKEFQRFEKGLQFLTHRTLGNKVWIDGLVMHSQVPS